MLGLAGMLLAGAAGAERWNVRDHLAADKIAVQSHRGAGVLMPENSLEAFELAWKLGTIPEADLRTTRDGVIVTFHDNNFKRILPKAAPAMKARGIKDLSWAEVRKLDIGAWKGKAFAGQRVSRMSDIYPVLAKHPERRMYVDIKNVDLEQLAREARSAGVAAQLILASTDYAVIRRWKALAPESATLHWMGGTEAELAGRFEKLRKSNFADITQLQIHVRTPAAGTTPTLAQAQPATPTLMPSPEFLRKAGEELRAHGIVFQALPWESRDPKMFWRLMDLGVASFATDYPDVTMQAIRDYYAQREK
jgi:glycerophosphoryl diester phosphodiesterase